MLFHLASLGNVISFVVLLSQAPATPVEEPPATDTLIPVEKWTYESGGRRDPFVPLLGMELGGGMTGHLSPENLKLIGILWGDRGYYALVKDGVDKGYILTRGDRVAGGHVSDVSRQGITFEIMHAGVVTKYEIRLQEDKERR